MFSVSEKGGGWGGEWFVNQILIIPMVRVETFFITNAFAFPQPPILFPNGDIPKLKQLL